MTERTPGQEKYSET